MGVRVMSNKQGNDKFVDKIGLANLLNLDEVADEDEARANKQKNHKEKE